ncbi:hypothetical protein PM082_018116 [Marasmius tenuissimus]|nr:hypothetical protein PM082_018116 [Marasmius tenuissimus]
MSRSSPASDSVSVAMFQAHIRYEMWQTTHASETFEHLRKPSMDNFTFRFSEGFDLYERMQSTGLAPKLTSSQNLYTPQKQTAGEPTTTGSTSIVVELPAYPPPPFSTANLADPPVLEPSFRKCCITTALNEFKRWFLRQLDRARHRVYPQRSTRTFTNVEINMLRDIQGMNALLVKMQARILDAHRS